jgi:3-oxoacyl-[acyl-carrier-protein] synthase-3
MNIEIRKIEYYLPQNEVSNAQLQILNPDWDMNKLAEKTGVLNRHIADKNETAFDLACKACEKLFLDNDIKESIDGIIFCTQSPDYIMPSNAFLIHKKFDFKKNVFAFDYNLACSGFVYGLVISRGLIATSVAQNILLINADTYSKYINPRDRSARILFGDGASVTVVSKAENEGLLDVMLASSGKDFESFYIPAGGCRLPKNAKTLIQQVDNSGNVHSDEDIHMNGFGVWKFIASEVPRQINDILKRNNISIADIDLFVFHQASYLTLDSLVKGLKIKWEKVFSNIAAIGNLVSASIPIALKDAQSKGKLKKGDLVLISGFGVGLSWGTIILRF